MNSTILLALSFGIVIVLIGVGAIAVPWWQRRRQISRPVVTCRAMRGGGDRPLMVAISKKDVMRLRRGSPIRIPLELEGQTFHGDLILLHVKSVGKSSDLMQAHTSSESESTRLMVVDDQWVRELPVNVDIDGIDITLLRAA